jgi:uncharacterized protein
VILLDSNIIMYAAGDEHPNRKPSQDLLALVRDEEVAAAVDAEVLQEILHRYRSLRRWDLAATVYGAVRRLIPVVEPITAELADVAAALLAKHRRLSARDAVHAAVALERGYEAICSYDRDFDDVPRLRRLEPPALLGSRH